LREQSVFFIAWLLGARPELCLLFGLLDPFLTLLTVMSLHGSKLIPRYFRRVDEPFRGVSFTTHAGLTPEQAPGCFKLLAIAVGAAEETARLSPTHRFVVFTGVLHMLLAMFCMWLPMIGVSAVYTVPLLRISSYKTHDFPGEQACRCSPLGR
jgi:hypothetical protein